MAKKTGIHKEYEFSVELEEVTGATHGSRPQAMKLVWAYIKENELQDENNGQFIFPDSALKPILGNSKRVKMTQIAKGLGAHLLED